VLATGVKGIFAIPHFDGFAAVLVQLRTVSKRPLRGVFEDAWLACAPDHLARAFLSGRRASSPPDPVWRPGRGRLDTIAKWSAVCVGGSYTR
jgi:hypothetical protein